MSDQEESTIGRTTSQLHYGDGGGGGGASGGGAGGGGDDGHNTLRGLLTCFGHKVPSSGNNNKSNYEKTTYVLTRK